MTTSEHRQHQTSTSPEEREIRENDTRQLVGSLVVRNADFLASPDNRLEFIQRHGSDDILAMAAHVNARLRGETPLQLRKDERENGGFLPMMHTPSREDKPECFRKGYQALQEYLSTSADSTDKKVQGAAMAVEALTIWVHPFNDGNGRTARFMAKLVEEGGTDIDGLVEETVSSQGRPMTYRNKLVSREELLEDAGNEDILYDDDERMVLRERAETTPNDADAIYLSVKHLLEDDSVRQGVLDRASAFKNSQLQHAIA